MRLIRTVLNRRNRVFSSIAILLLGGSAVALTIFIVGGRPTVDVPSLAALIYAGGGDETVQCSGTLVAPTAVVTAAHCLEGGAPTQVFFQHAGRFNVYKAIPFAAMQGTIPDAEDIALLVLSNSVTGITPARLNEESLSPETVVQLAGFGWHSVLANRLAITQMAGIKYIADSSTMTCPTTLASALVCTSYSFNAPSGGSVCKGDSGGPLFVTSTGTIGGVTVGGYSCLPGDIPRYVPIASYVSWIKTTLAANSLPGPPSAVIGPSLGPILNDGSRYPVHVTSAIDSTGSPLKFTVVTNVTELRVAANATHSGSPITLQLMDGVNTQVCDETGVKVALFCSVKNPQPGLWSVSVSGVTDQEFQLVATTI